MKPPPQRTPLYDPVFEHDACGVGFVADAGGRNRKRVLPLALAGLAALGHRGAFAADGESSDGAGVALPLEGELLERIAPDAARWLAADRATCGRQAARCGRPGIVMAFVPRQRARSARARRIVAAALRAEGLELRRWREVPTELDALGREARATAPAVVQALVNGPPEPDRATERRLVLARRRMEAVARARGLEPFSVASASARTVVYKGLVAGAALAAFYPDLRGALPVSYAVFHQRYATNTMPRWALAQPFRFIAHNGEINTVRGNREQLRGGSGRLGGGEFGQRLAALGPLVSPDGSDSLSLDEMVELLVAAGWRPEAALLAALPEALALRDAPHRAVRDFQQRVRGFMAPWDGPAAIVFADGRRVGALLDRNGLRPAAYNVTHDGLVALASEAGAVPLGAAETKRRGRLGPGEMLLVEPGSGAIWHDAAAKDEALRHVGAAGMPPRVFVDRPHGVTGRGGPTAVEPDPAADAPLAIRWLLGLDAERLRLDIRTMAIEAREPLWSMGDDTPLPGLARRDRRVVDHLRQSFAQVTNPAIDPDRERAVMDLRVALGRRSPLLSRLPARPATLELGRPFVADLPGLLAAFAERADGHRARVWALDATWAATDGPGGLARALARLAEAARVAASKGSELLVVSDRAAGPGRLPVPSVLALGAVNTALAGAGLRGQADLLADAGDVLDVHAAAMALAAGASAVCPWLALELAAETAGERGAEELTPAHAVSNLLEALERGLRKVLARMGISGAASYVGGQFFEVLELDGEVARRCFPAAPIRAGFVGFAELAERQLRRLEQAPAAASTERLPDPGFARYRADGEMHAYAPSVVRAMQALAARSTGASGEDGDLAAYRTALARRPALVRDQLALRPSHPVPLQEVEPAGRILRRFVSSAMSLGSLSPEAHQALTLGMRLVGAASNTGEGGEDPDWYGDGDGRRRDSAIKQVASARFGVTAAYLARADQLEIKIAQGSKPGEGGQLPGKKATAYIAALRRGQPGQSMISPPPHHDIYSIEDLAQLIADLRAINPSARIGVKLVAAIGIGTIAAGVAKAGADYIQVSGHAGGTGASPLSSIKHAGIPWELGLAEVHQVLLHNGLRDRVALRVDGGLQSGRDVLIAALLGAEEFGFGTAALVALGCDMARQCHLDTCPTGIATQREDLRAKFQGSPEDVARLFRAIAEDVREELAAVGARSLGEVIGETERLLPGEGPHTLDLGPLLAAPPWAAHRRRRDEPRSATTTVSREVASALEAALVGALPRRDGPGLVYLAQAEVTTADRSLGAQLSGALARRPPGLHATWRLKGAAGQSFGAFLGPRIELELIGQANDYVAKGLSGGIVRLLPEPELRAVAAEHAIAGNTCLYGATGGRLHVVGRAGMRFAVRNSGAEAVVEGLGPHGCEYMTGGVVVVLGPVGRNFGAGMTGGRAYLYDPSGRSALSLAADSVRATRLAVLRERDDGWERRGDGWERRDELERLLRLHAAAGSLLAGRLLEDLPQTLGDSWLVEPLDTGMGRQQVAPANFDVVAAAQASIR